MKNVIFLLIFILSCLTINAQSVIGGWERYHTSETGEPLKSVVIFSEGYQVLTTYNAKTGKFIHSNGGTWKLEGDMMTEKVEFHTDNAERVGTEVRFKVIITDNTIEVVGSDLKLTRIDNGTPGELQGAWLISGRKRNGEIQEMDTNRPRKTMKILSGTRFQWIAYNTETKQFMGTGGGTYTTVNGDYTEHIEFFSRDESRVGASLAFNFELVDGHWHHKGLSSKGQPIHEIWSIRK
ncbi:membrane or secreted protein [Winogradskyella immobilis]|uniref:Membrane or secreted protein n=1 Tax=Winogradskyella immobilis TaxID=2816852 RepID=A0ABS8EJB4_9FLAO|nr:membrane or secreted protein [Winogradskyella immobilis]MCC1483126.1 membrane or secreted protein [Winogradskyella immobilis]MCG0015221.1 membrane or secreted protein [Winogradskyella immobilis]